MALWGEPGAMIDGMYTLTTDDLTCNNNHKYNTLYILSVQATVQCGYLNRSMVSRNLYRYVMKAGI